MECISHKRNKNFKTTGESSSISKHKAILKSNDSDCRVKNGRQQSKINNCNMNNFCTSPQQNLTLLSLGNIKVENTTNYQFDSFNNLSTIPTEWSPKETKVFEKLPLLIKKEVFSPNDDVFAQQAIKKNDINTDIANCNQFYDTYKSELTYNDTPDMEAIDMLHDLDSVIKFDESKISMDLQSSAANDTMENYHNAEKFNHTVVGPLLLPDDYKNYGNMKDHEDQEKRNEHDGPKLQKKRHHCDLESKASDIQNVKKARKTENSDIDYRSLKEILGELDIDFIEEKSDTENEASECKLQELYNIKITLVHEVPLQHRIEHTAGSKSITKGERKLFLQYGPLKNGTFTPSEDKIIKDNWITFCKVHHWDSKHIQPFLYMKNSDNKFYIKSLTERQKFVQFLANGLPWRTLYSVYHRFRYLYGNYKKSFKRYTAKEDGQILSYIKQQQNEGKTRKTFVELGKMLGRTSHSIWLRYQLLKKMKRNEQDGIIASGIDVKWTLPLIGKFITTFMKVTLCEDIQELKDAFVPKPVWKKLEKKLEIDHNVLRNFWILQLHMQLFCSEPIYLNDIKIKLIEYFYGKGIGHTREIIWKSVAKYFDGVPTIFLCKTFLYLVQDAAMKIGTTNFPDVIEYLYEKKIRNIRNEKTDKFLPRLSYDKGIAKVIDDIMDESVEAYLTSNSFKISKRNCSDQLKIANSKCKPSHIAV